MDLEKVRIHSYEELLEWENELKVISLIDPVTYTDNDLLHLINMGIPSGKEGWRAFDSPHLVKLVAWAIQNINEDDIETKEDTAIYFYKYVLQNFKGARQSAISAATIFKQVINDYYKFKNNLYMEKENDKLRNWFGAKGKAG